MLAPDEKRLDIPGILETLHVFGFSDFMGCVFAVPVLASSFHIWPICGNTGIYVGSENLRYYTYPCIKPVVHTRNRSIKRSLQG